MITSELSENEKLTRIYIYIRCYFHVQSNVKKNYKDKEVAVQFQANIKKDIIFMHFSLNYNDFCARWSYVCNKWKNLNLNKFSCYFYDIWISPTIKNLNDENRLPNYFTMWQVFNTPPGYSTTNSPIESINKQIKQTFTNYERHSVYELTKIIGDIIVYYSLNQAFFNLNTPKPSIELINKAKKYTSEQFKSSQEFVTFTGYNNMIKSYYYLYINLQEKTCSCSTFLDKAVCHHLVAAASIYKISLPSINVEREFSILKKAGRPKKAGTALEKEDEYEDFYF